MPLTKNAYLRLRLIDRLLRDNSYVKTSKILDELWEKHRISVVRKTINNDIHTLKTDFQLPIEEDKGRHAWYFAENAPRVFPALELKEQEIMGLLFYSKTLGQYKGYPLFDDMNLALQEVLDKSNIPTETRKLFEQKTLLETTEHPYVQGTEFIPDLLNAIGVRQTLHIVYQKFRSKFSAYTIKPVLLKENQMLWYLIGEDDKTEEIRTLALDRIISITLLKKFFEPIVFNSEQYFKDAFGITVSDVEPIEIVISFTSQQGDYIKTLKIHHSQEPISDTSKAYIIKIFAKPTYELLAKLRSYGSDAQVLSPPEIIAKLREDAERVYQKYKRLSKK